MKNRSYRVKICQIMLKLCQVALKICKNTIFCPNLAICISILTAPGGIIKCEVYIPVFITSR